MQTSHPIPSWLDRVENPYIHGSFAPSAVETEGGAEMKVSGTIPRDLAGMYVRNGPNPALEPLGRYHWFDGDGMVHAIRFEDGKAYYRNRWVHTDALQLERKSGQSMWHGIMDRHGKKNPFGVGPDRSMKDTANTDVVFHAGKLYALWYQCGEPYAMDPLTLEPRGKENFGGRLPRFMSAHAHVDENTEEMFFFDYSVEAPYYMYHVAGADGKLQHSVDMGFPGCRLTHDMALTEHYAIHMDMPFFWDETLLARGVHKVAWHDLPTRWAVIPRRGTQKDIRWFETKPMFMHHVVNAWEEHDEQRGDEIVLLGCKVQDGWPFVKASDDSPLKRMMGYLRLDARIYEWRFNLKTGRASERFVEEGYNLEFPTINMRRQGFKTRYSYYAHLLTEPAQLFNALFKHDNRTGRLEHYMLPEGTTLSEAPFAQRSGGTEEDDGYIVTFAHDAIHDRSSCLIFAAQDIRSGPIASIELPARVPMGFHAKWVSAERLNRRAVQ